MVTPVVRYWKASEEPFDEQGTHILIEGRTGGLLAWLLHLVQIEPLTRLRVSAERAELERVSLSGKEHVFVPLERICHFLYSYNKPWKKSLVIFFLFYIILRFIFPVIISLMVEPRALPGFYDLTSTLAAVLSLGIAMAYYLLNKTFRLSVFTSSGIGYALSFKRSVIGNQKIDADDAAYLVEMLDYLCDARRQPGFNAL